MSAKPELFCGVIQAVLCTDVCPLDKGQCMWQHRATHACCFTSGELTEQSFAELVGLPVVSSVDYQVLRSRIISEVKESEL